MTTKKILTIARFNRLKNVLFFLLCAALFSFSFIYSLLNEQDLLTIIVAAILAVASIIAVIWHLAFVFVPLRERAFRRYGSAENYADLVTSHENAEVVYTDRYVTITPFAISIHKKPLETLDVYDILAVYKAKRSTETILETESLILVDAWGEQNVIPYRRRDRKRLNSAISALNEVCDEKLTKFGETVEALEWIAQNCAPLPKYDRKTKSIQMPEDFEEPTEEAPKESPKPKQKSTGKANSTKATKATTRTKTKKK